MSDVVCFYHAGCQDGAVAAWVVSQLHPNAHLVPVKYADSLPHEDLYRNKRVYIVDFSYSSGEIQVMSGKAESIVMLDHHASAIDRWKDVEMQTVYSNSTPVHQTVLGNVQIVFDVEHSGAMLAWEWCQEEHMREHLTLEEVRNPTKMPNPFFAYQHYDPESRHVSVQPHNVPNLVKYVEDRDLWKWQLPDSQEVNAYLRTQPMTNKSFDEIYERMETGNAMPSIVQAGRSIMAREEQIVDKHVRRAVEKQIAGHKVPVVNATELHSEIGHALCKDRPFAVMYFDDLERNKRVWSFRSSDEGVDVKEVAMSFGGGGHRNAAGCQTDIGVNIFK